MPDTVVTLGDFDFAGTEVPERIPFGGAQMFAMHKLPGGARIVDAMGRDDMALRWSGRFQGENAKERAYYLNNLRQQGKALVLSWSDLRFQVLITEFTGDWERSYQVPYSITCEIIADLGSPTTSAPAASLDDAVSDDMLDAVDMGFAIGDAPLNGQLDALSQAVRQVSDLFNAGADVLGTVLRPLGGALTRVSTLIVAAEAIERGVTTIGGVVPGLYGQAPGLILQTANADQLARSYELRSLLNRVLANVLAAGSSGTDVSVAGGTLQAIAALRFGDPNQWTAIARATGVQDPVVSGVQTLRIPARRDRTGGVLHRA